MSTPDTDAHPQPRSSRILNAAQIPLGLIAAATSIMSLIDDNHSAALGWAVAAGLWLMRGIENYTPPQQTDN